MIALVLVGISSLIATWALTPLLRDFFGFLEMVDRPDTARKLHVRPIPRVGGIALAVSYIGVLLTLVIAASFWREMLTESGSSLKLLFRLMPALLAVIITGLVDDFFGVTPLQKIGGLLVAGMLAVWAGVRLAPVEGWPHSELWLMPVSVLWLVFCSNAINLIDGMDGLASGVALLASVGLMLAALIHHHPVLALATAPLVGSLLGFLYYNFNPATVFLGDCGSLLIGFLLGCFGLMWNQNAAAGFDRYAPIMAMAVPVAEVGISIARRFLRQQPIFNPDRNHIHHRLLLLGMTQRRAALILYGVAALCVALFLLHTIARPSVGAVLVILFASCLYFGIHALRYNEFRAVGRCLFGGELRGMLQMRICLKDLEDNLQRARSVEDCWVAVKEACSAAGFRSVLLTVQGNRFELHATAADTRQRRVSLPLWSGSLTLAHDADASMAPMWIAPIVHALDDRLRLLLPHETEAAVVEPPAEWAAASH